MVARERFYTDTTTGTPVNRRGFLPIILSALVGFLVGWGIGDIGDSGKHHGLPAGPPTDNVSGPSPSDAVGPR